MMAGALLLALGTMLMMLSIASASASRAHAHAHALPLCPSQPSPDAPTYVEQINLTKCAHGCADLPQCASITSGGFC